jgi:predicted O-methyltransferase YrrM
MESPLTVREVVYRLSDPAWVASHTLRQATTLYDVVSPSEFSRLYRQIRHLTMVSNARLRGLHRAVKQVVGAGVPGDIVECGTARGGSAALMGLTLKQLGVRDRRLWVFDTYEGLPAPPADDPDYDIAQSYTGSCLGTLEDVTASFQQLGVDDISVFVKGLFQDTLAGAEVRTIALLHIDGDWYESVKVCLDTLYDRVSDNGVIQLDDFGFWKGARKAVEEFFEERRIAPRLIKVDYSGRQFVKPAQGR